MPRVDHAFHARTAPSYERTVAVLTTVLNLKLILLLMLGFRPQSGFAYIRYGHQGLSAVTVRPFMPVFLCSVSVHSTKICSKSGDAAGFRNGDTKVGSSYVIMSDPSRSF